MRKNDIAEALLCESVVQAFRIEGLFGYRSVSLNMKNAASVLIAKNGAGKTTTMGALDAFLKRQFFRFATLEFSRITCSLKGVENPIVLTKADIAELAKFTSNRKFQSFLALFEGDAVEFSSLIIANYADIKKGAKTKGYQILQRKLMTRSRTNVPSSREYIVKLLSIAEDSKLKVFSVSEAISNALDGYEVVYLPTYRRIELALPVADETRPGVRHANMQEKLGLSKQSLHSGDIQFGLSDISERLSDLNETMLFESNQGYREISANIVNDLLDGIFENEHSDVEIIPSKESLALFFERIKGGRRYIGPYSDVQVPDLDKIYNENEVPERSRKFLKYFLGKLNTVMLKTKNIESMVEEFINCSNEYLSSKDRSTELPLGIDHRGADDLDGKQLSLDRRTFKVSVSSISGRREIPLDALSSGEKQMISLFAKMYLYPNKKIVLIDEPELSLSIEWQQKILIDIFRAETCAQLIAITHSPFIFDNELEPLAAPLEIGIENPNETLESGYFQEDVNA